MINSFFSSVDLLELVYGSVTLVVTTIIIPILKELFQYIKSKSHNALYFDTITKIENVVKQAVLCTSQTYVDTLKSQDSFDDASKKVAFDNTKDAILNMLSDEMQNFIVYYHKNLDAWIDTKIEEMLKIEEMFKKEE